MTDVSSARWVAYIQSLPRLRATLSIATCFVLRTRAVRWFFWQRALSWRAALRCRARSLSRLHKRAWKSLKGDRPTGPTHGRLLLLRLSPWTFACARPPDAWRLPLVCGVWCWGFRPPVWVSSSGVRHVPAQRGAAPRRPSCCLTSVFSYSGGGAWVATLTNPMKLANCRFFAKKRKYLQLIRLRCLLNN